MDLHAGMKVEVVTTYKPVTGLVIDGTDVPPWMPGARKLFGWTGSRGGPDGNHSRPWSDRCLCNECVADPAKAERVRSRLTDVDTLGPGRFIEVPFTRAWVCASCGKKADR